MSACAPALTKTWAVGRYTATLTVPRLSPGQVAHGTVEWAPTVPDKLTAEEQEAYRRGLQAALAEVDVAGPAGGAERREGGA